MIPVIPRITALEAAMMGRRGALEGSLQELTRRSPEVVRCTKNAAIARYCASV